jgi:hypothetical protein
VAHVVLRVSRYLGIPHAYPDQEGRQQRGFEAFEITEKRFSLA